MTKWIKIDDQSPPKDKPFLAITEGLIDIMTWHKNLNANGDDIGWFTQYSSFCCCCTEYCSFKFSLWMPLPSLPKDEL